MTGTAPTIDPVRAAGDRLMIGAAMAAEESLAARVAALRWYHTLELPGGVLTPGGSTRGPRGRW